MNLQSGKPSKDVDNINDSFQTFSKTCSVIYNKISKKQYEYLQAMSGIQDDIFDSCNGLVKQQVDILEDYVNSGLVSKEYMMPLVEMANRLIESYLSYISLEYNLALSRTHYHHKILQMINDVTPKLMKTYLEYIKQFKTFSLSA
jgi:hypothetical protein